MQFVRHAALSRIACCDGNQGGHRGGDASTRVCLHKVLTRFVFIHFGNAKVIVRYITISLDILTSSPFFSPLASQELFVCLVS